MISSLEMLFWLKVALLLWGLVDIAFGFAKWSSGGAARAYRGLVITVGMGFVLLPGVVSPTTAAIIMAPALVILAVWFIQQWRGQWPPMRRPRTTAR